MHEAKQFTFVMMNILKRFRVIIMLIVNIARKEANRYQSHPEASEKWPTRSTSMRPVF